MSSRVERYAGKLSLRVKQSVKSASASKTAARLAAADNFLGESLEPLRSRASAIKDDVLNRMPELLTEFEKNAKANGIVVHHAATGPEACAIVLELARKHVLNGEPIVKAKSMATEEIHLNAALEAEGFHPIETDLGEFVVQLDGDTPSHIVTPIIHKDRYEVAESFRREGVGEYSDDPETLTLQARAYLREKFRTAAMGISGVNFAIAESGRIVLVENEGNNRLSTTAPKIHVAVMGIEKLIPRDADLGVFLRLLALSSTGQQITTYTHFIHGPRKPDEPDGPEELHLILLDNGRTRVRSGPYRDILKCIRCGACLNVCPVYRQASGHAYGHVYSGPLGAVLAPALEGTAAMGDLAKASTLCGACEEVCPVKIPIPDLLLKLREESARQSARPEWAWFGTAAMDAAKWRAGLKLLPLAKHVPHPMKSLWTEHHAFPEREGQDFRSWWRSRPHRPPPAPPSKLASPFGRRGVSEPPPRSWGRGPENEEGVGGGEANYPPRPAGEGACEDREQGGEGSLSPSLSLARGRGWGGSVSSEPGSPEVREFGQDNPEFLEVFLKRFEAVGGKIGTLDDLLTLAQQPFRADDDAKALLPAEAGAPDSSIWEAEVGFTLADALVAETGSIYVATGSGRHRMHSLAPPIHIVLARKSQIVPSLDEAIELLEGRSSALITGPSRTADIEGVMVRGVHGPRELWLIWLDD